MKSALFPIWLSGLLIAKNPCKFIMIALAMLMFSKAGTIPDVTYSTPVMKEIEIGGKWAYVYEGSDGIEIKSYGRRQILKDGCLTGNRYAGGNVMLWLGFGFMAVILIFGSFDGTSLNGDGWVIQPAFSEAVGICTRCEIEDGQYVYTVFGRLISKEGRQKNFSWYNLSELSSLPRYSTRSQKRNKALGKLGV